MSDNEKHHQFERQIYEVKAKEEKEISDNGAGNRHFRRKHYEVYDLYLDSWMHNSITCALSIKTLFFIFV